MAAVSRARKLDAAVKRNAIQPASVLFHEKSRDTAAPMTHSSIA